MGMTYLCKCVFIHMIYDSNNDTLFFVGYSIVVSIIVKVLPSFTFLTKLLTWSTFFSHFTRHLPAQGVGYH